MSVPQQTILNAAELVRFLSGLTGLHLGVVSAPPPGVDWDVRQLVSGCRGHALRSNTARLHSYCESCARFHLRLALAAPRMGHDYEGPCGVRSFLLPVNAGGRPVGVMTLRRAPEILQSAPPHGARVRRHDALFRRAMRLLQPLARDTAWRVGGNGHPADPKSALPVPAPARPAAAPSAPGACDCRSHHAVHALLERMRREFAAPLELKQLARESGLNPSYLSTVFAREAGMPFKSYLTALRIEHSQLLLRDPRLRIAEIAGKVGYATPRRFRAAFREWTGFSPGQWRAGRHP